MAATASSETLAISPDLIGQKVYEGILQAACGLRPDVAQAMELALDSETSERGQRILAQLLENNAIAQRDHVPLCQDTGAVWVNLEVGEDLSIPGNIFSTVNDAVEAAYRDGKLRMSVVKDALFDRRNTQTNCPAFCDLQFRAGHGLRLSILLKGGGSDNASRLVMLAPGAGRDGIRHEILRCVKEKAANACPPLLIGIGVGGTFDSVAKLAKHALLRPIGSAAASTEAAQLEEELLAEINATGIGPAALGGSTTALAVHIESAPCHIAALPLAINMGCSAVRSVNFDLIPFGDPEDDCHE